MYYMIYPIACGIIRAIIIASTHLAFVIYVYCRSQSNSRHRQELITYQSLLTEPHQHLFWLFLQKALSIQLQ